MTKELVEFPLSDGSTVVFETDVSGQPALDQRISRDSGVTRSNQTFETVASKIRPAAQLVLEALKEMNTPREIEIEFGLKFSATTGVIIASADSEMNFKVRLLWENPSRGQS